MPGCDPDLVRPLEKRIKARYGEILLNTQVTAVTAAKDGLQVSFATRDGAKSSNIYDYVLVAVGRTPNGRHIGADAAGVQVDVVRRGLAPTANGRDVVEVTHNASNAGANSAHSRRGRPRRSSTST